MSTPEKYSHIDFTPPATARKRAESGLALRREHGRGGTSVGIARARDISNGVSLSPSTVKRMKAFFDRHAGDSKAPGFKKGEEGYPSNGKIADLLWGGRDSGYAWARKVVSQMDAADEAEGRSLRPFGSSQGIEPKVVVVHGPPGSGKTTYVKSNRGPNDVTYDFDSIMQALSGMPPHRRNENLISYCQDIRSLIIERALHRSRVEKTWIVTTRADESLRKSLGDVPVEYVHMDTPKDECIRRVTEDPERREIADETTKVIESYFSETSQRSLPMQPNIERRFIGAFSSSESADNSLLRVEQRADPESGAKRTYIVGYAAKFGKNSLLLGDFIERLSPTAFEIVENGKDFDGKPLETRCLFNHSPDHLLGRFPTTLKMVVDEVGLRYECLLPESRADLKELIARGDLKGSSFSFVVAEGGEKWTTEDGQSIRLITKIKSLIDVSPVTYPAYSDATVAVAQRSYEAYREGRGFCATGDGGGVDNSCGAGSGKSGKSEATLDKARKAADDFNRPVKPSLSGSTASGAAYGSLVGTTVGTAVGGVIGAAAGGLAGAAIGSIIGAGKFVLVDMNDKKFVKVKESIGLSDTGLRKAAGRIFGKDGGTSFAFDGKTIAIEGKKDPESIALITDGSPFDKSSKGMALHYQSSSTGGGFDSSAVEKAARDIGAKSVSVEVWSSGDAKALKSSGYRLVSPSPGGYSKSKGIYEKKLGKSKRASEVLSEMRDFIAERRAGNDCGRDESGKFGSGNKCQDEDGGKGVSGDTPDLAKKYGFNGGIGGDDKPDLAKKYGIGGGIGGGKSGKDLAGEYGKKLVSDDKPDLAKKYGFNGGIGGDDKPDLAKKYGFNGGIGGGKYMELKKGDKSPDKMKKAQDFIDKAREEQLSKGGKNKGKSDDGGGVQTWSKGDHFPWTPKQVGTDKGYVQGQHPDGSKTEKYHFDGDASEAWKKMSDEVKRRKGSRSLNPDKVAADMLQFLKDRSRG